MNGYYKYTPVRIAIPFSLGIICMIFSEIKLLNFSLSGFSVFCFVAMIGAGLFTGANYRNRWLTGLMGTLGLFFAGAALVQMIENRKCSSIRTFEGSDEIVCILRVAESPAARPSSLSCKTGIMAIRDSTGRWIVDDTRAMVYFELDTLSEDLKLGDLLVARAKISEITGPANPGEFNYKKYLSNKQIWHQLSIESGQWKRIANNQANPLILFANRSRQAFLETFRRFNIVGQDFALVSALLLGNCEYLDAEIRQEFSYAGASHVLSVSGLHVGIVYIAAGKLLFFLRRNRKTRKLQTILTILLIWAYALITGMSTPVTRAALMFSLVAAGKMFRRNSEGFNILATAAFLQLLINPYEVTQVGFQLSYLAVAGIFAFYKPINQLVVSNNRVISWIWPVLAVSVAAQLSTSPISIYYFKMFPVYFLLTNLIVVPLSGIIIYVAMALLFAGVIGFTPFWLGLPLQWSLQLMRFSVDTIQSWPGAVYQPIVVSTFQVLLIYLIIISAFVFIILRNRRWAFAFLGSVLMLAMTDLWLAFNKSNSRELIVYSIPRHLAVDMMNDKKALFIADSTVITDEKKLKNKIFPSRLINGIRQVSTFSYEEFSKRNIMEARIDFPFLFFQGKRVVFIDDTLIYFKPAVPIDCDLGIISSLPRTSMKDLIKNINLRYLVIASSVPGFQCRQLAGELKELGVPFHVVREQGAFCMKW